MDLRQTSVSQSCVCRGFAEIWIGTAFPPWLGQDEIGGDWLSVHARQDLRSRVKMIAGGYVDI